MEKDQSIEDEITGEFMRQLRKSDVDFDIVEAIEPLTAESDFGGREKISETVLQAVKEHATE